ncbi:MAG: malto-oligosyltrehalose trehalohydrolase [Pseudomonadota bacterium]|nr:malto-oligosyltrehalose trehalohydrolase [Pseudomonadota bacterium]
MDDRTTRFRLWAPSHERVDLELADGTSRTLEPSQDGTGWHEATLLAPAGTRYRYRLAGQSGAIHVPDPASRAQDGDVHDYSIVIDHARYRWKNDSWRGRPWHEAVIYELHPGLLGGFRGVEQKLEELAAIGFTAIELMPVSDFPGPRNWGYDGVLPFAPDAAYGSPDDLKHLIDAAHGWGLMVFLDVVYNHFGPDGNYLSLVAPEFFREDVHTLWGPAIDFRHPDVLAFFTQNAVQWVVDYRFDGLRFDAVHAITESERLDDLASAVRAAAGPDRFVHLVLENDDNDAARLEPARRGFDAQWNDDAHHVLHVLLTGETGGYYVDYADDPAVRLARVLSAGFDYQGQPSAHREGERRGSPSGHLPPTAFVDCLQNHDQIGNRPLGERLTSLADKDALRAATALLLLSPHIPMVFMGEEGGSCDPFLYFTSHGAELAELVKEGRRKEFAGFAQFADAAARDRIPDPNAPASFDRSQLRNFADPSATRAFYQELISLRMREIVPQLPGARSVGARPLGEKAVEAAWRLGDDSLLVIATNLGSAPVSWPHHFAPANLLFSSRASSIPRQLDGYCTVAYRQAEPQGLRDLAAAAGVQTEWTDHLGHTRHVSETSVRAILQALRLPHDGEDEIAASLRRLRSASNRPGLVTGRLPEPLRIRLPAHVETSLSATLCLESGALQQVELQPERTGEDEVWVSLRVQETGYHRLCLAGADGPLEIHLAMAPQHAQRADPVPAWATAVQLYSLRAEHARAGLDAGVGDYSALCAFAEAAGRAGAQAVAVSPTHAGFSANPSDFSPYSPSSRLFYNALFIDPVAEFGRELASRVAEAAGLAEELRALADADPIDWARTGRAKLTWLRALYDRSADRGRPASDALRKHAVFETLHAHFMAQGLPDWHGWPAAYQHPDSPAVERFADAHRSDVEFHAWLQDLAGAGLQRAQRAAKRSGMRIGIVADMAVGMSPAGSHAWADQEQVVGGLEIGAPPDLLNPDGQKWGLATFAPASLVEHAFEPFISTLRAVLAHAGGVRVDHILGLRRLWLVPTGCPASAGAYVEYPFDDLLNLLVLESHRHGALVIGEDLGTVPAGMRETLASRGVLGMSVLWFERAADGAFKPPGTWRESSVAMTTTHDLPTAAGWWQAQDVAWRGKLFSTFDTHAARAVRARERVALAALAPAVEPGDDGVDLAIDVVASAAAPLAIVPVEDLLGVLEQPNFPGTIHEHPNWRQRLPRPADLLFDDARVRRRTRRLNQSRHGMPRPQPPQ